MSSFKKMMEALDKPVKGVPTVDQVRARFIDYETEMSHCAGWIDGVSDEYGEAFDRWLDLVRAEAWLLGVGGGMFYGPLDIPPNPYRQE
ncbi:hypothetical protein [Flaviflexus massiliensis]|uniref:hypothetical protein n=1 Tax=Flaviflexus massiliensis TaxID=1522309 RepID=UPI0006D595B6|nr:hypothetical protein [Flaviflexus massiliensis]